MKKALKVIGCIVVSLLALIIVVSLVYKFVFDPYHGTNYDYTEAKELKRNGKYFVGNCVGLLIEDNQKEINEAIQLAEYINKSFHIKTILFCDYDYDVEARNKKISEIVSGPCFRGDMFLEVLNNV